jgi:hypothetical protein
LTDLLDDPLHSPLYDAGHAVPESEDHVRPRITILRVNLQRLSNAACLVGCRLTCPFAGSPAAFLTPYQLATFLVRFG